MVIVKHVSTGKHFILLGASYSYFKDSRPSFLGGDLFPHEEQGEFHMTAVSDGKGDIYWFSSNELVVVKVDGCSPKTILEEFQGEERIDGNEMEEIEERCPACGEKVRSTDKECPGCGLVLIIEG